MALAETLSAVRQLILDPIDIPADQPSRLVLYRSRFPSLSEHEAEDLSKMEPSRLRLYSSSIFSAEGNILKNNFPFSVALVSAAWRAQRGEELSPSELARTVHEFAPWRGIHSDSLGESLLSFVRGARAPSISFDPALAEILRFEIANYRIKKAKTEPYRPQAKLDRTALAAKTVDDFLAQPLYVPGLVSVFESNFDVMEARTAFLAHRDGPLPEIPEARCCIAGARPLEYGVRWVRVSSEIASVLKRSHGVTGDAMATVADLASAFLADGEFQSEEEAFVAFLDTLDALVESGVVCVAPEVSGQS